MTLSELNQGRLVLFRYVLRRCFRSADIVRSVGVAVICYPEFTGNGTKPPSKRLLFVAADTLLYWLPPLLSFLECPMSDDDPEESPQMQRVRSDLANHHEPHAPSDVYQPIRPASPVKPPRIPVLDSELAADVRACLGQDGRLDSAIMTVTVREGIVTVAGSVSLEFQRSLVTASINEIPGVLNVRNLLKVL